MYFKQSYAIKARKYILNGAIKINYHCKFSMGYFLIIEKEFWSFDISW